MNVCVICAILLFALFEGTGSQNAKLDEACQYDKDCITDLTYCKNQQTCQCMAGYVPVATRDRCTATQGTACKQSYDCTDTGNLANSECIQDICSCKQDYVVHSNKSICLRKPTTLLEPCVETLQCTAAFGTASFCDEQKKVCECTSGHHFANNSCITSVGIRGACSQSYQCYIKDNGNQTVGECIDNVCHCKQGYVDAGDHCDNGASLFATTFFASLFLLIVSRIVV